MAHPVIRPLIRGYTTYSVVPEVLSYMESMDDAFDRVQEKDIGRPIESRKHLISTAVTASHAPSVST